jgi:hypothetical protein
MKAHYGWYMADGWVCTWELGETGVSLLRAGSMIRR